MRKNILVVLEGLENTCKFDSEFKLYEKINNFSKDLLIIVNLLCRLIKMKNVYFSWD